jgi:hypothetical protein
MLACHRSGASVKFCPLVLVSLRGTPRMDGHGRPGGLDDVFVPDDRVVGEVNGGWKAGDRFRRGGSARLSHGESRSAGRNGVHRGDEFPEHFVGDAEAGESGKGMQGEVSDDLDKLVVAENAGWLPVRVRSDLAA